MIPEREKELNSYLGSNFFCLFLALLVVNWELKIASGQKAYRTCRTKEHLKRSFPRCPKISILKKNKNKKTLFMHVKKKKIILKKIASNEPKHFSNGVRCDIREINNTVLIFVVCYLILSKLLNKGKSYLMRKTFCWLFIQVLYPIYSS